MRYLATEEPIHASDRALTRKPLQHEIPQSILCLSDGGASLTYISEARSPPRTAVIELGVLIFLEKLAFEPLASTPARAYSSRTTFEVFGSLPDGGIDDVAQTGLLKNDASIRLPWTTEVVSSGGNGVAGVRCHSDLLKTYQLELLREARPNAVMIP